MCTSAFLGVCARVFMHTCTIISHTRLQLCVDHWNIYLNCATTYSSPTIAALEVSIRDEYECIDVHTDCTTHDIGGNFKVSEQTLANLQ